jgi:AraC-like DNA-binding protein
VLPFDFNENSYQKVVFPGPDFICLFYSSSEIKWNNGNTTGILRSGGVAVFDCQKLFTYTVSTPAPVCFIFIPYQLYDRKVLKIILEGKNFIYSDIILSIIRSIDNEENENLLKGKILSLVHMLSVVDDPTLPVVKLSLFERIINVIKEHALDPFFSLSKAASLSFCSKRTFHSCLSKQGLSYSKLINDFRINHLAEKLLMDKNLRVDSLCYNSGFNSPSYASKQFKLLKGISPKQYRKEAFLLRLDT